MTFASLVNPKANIANENYDSKVDSISQIVQKWSDTNHLNKESNFFNN